MCAITVLLHIPIEHYRDRDGAYCNLYTPKSKNLKNFYYLGAKAWNSLPIDLRNMSDPKVFGKNFTRFGNK